MTGTSRYGHPHLRAPAHAHRTSPGLRRAGNLAPHSATLHAHIAKPETASVAPSSGNGGRSDGSDTTRPAGTPQTSTSHSPAFQAPPSAAAAANRPRPRPNSTTPRPMPRTAPPTSAAAPATHGRASSRTPHTPAPPASGPHSPLVRPSSRVLNSHTEACARGATSRLKPRPPLGLASLLRSLPTAPKPHTTRSTHPQ